MVVSHSETFFFLLGSYRVFAQSSFHLVWLKGKRAYPDKNQFSSRLVGTHQTLYIILYIVVGTDAPDGSNWSSMHTMTSGMKRKKKNVKNLNLPTHRLRVLNSTVGGPPHSSDKDRWRRTTRGNNNNILECEYSNYNESWECQTKRRQVKPASFHHD